MDSNEQTPITNVYLMLDEPTGYYKVGRSRNPHVRERTLLAQAPKITLLCYWADCPEWVESKFHKILQTFRRRGEWFELDDRAIAYIMAYGEMNDLDRIDVRPFPEHIHHLKRIRSFRMFAKVEWNKRYDIGSHRRWGPTMDRLSYF